MGGLECVITGLMDEFKDTFVRWKISREMFTGFIVVVSFIVALCCITPVGGATVFRRLFFLERIFQGGFYVFTLLETYVAGVSLLLTVFFEAVAVSWLYGLDNFKSDVQKMLGHVPNLYWRICWKLISPAFLFVRTLYQQQSLSIFTKNLYFQT